MAGVCPEVHISFMPRLAGKRNLHLNVPISPFSSLCFCFVVRELLLVVKAIFLKA